MLRLLAPLPPSSPSMVFDPWGRCRPATYRTRNAASTAVGNGVLQLVVSCPHADVENDIRRSSRKLDTSSISRRRTTDRNWTRRPVPRALASLRALLRTIIPPFLSSHSSSLCSSCSISSNNAKRTVQSVIIPRYTSKIADSFSS